MTIFAQITKQASDNMVAAKSFQHFAKMTIEAGELVCIVKNKKGQINRQHDSFSFTLNGQKISKEEVIKL